MRDGVARPFIEHSNLIERRLLEKFRAAPSYETFPGILASLTPLIRQFVPPCEEGMDPFLLAFVSELVFSGAALRPPYSICFFPLRGSPHDNVFFGHELYVPLVSSKLLFFSA